MAATCGLRDREPEKKVFKPKFPLLVLQQDYTPVTDKQFWQCFPVNSNTVAKSNIDGKSLLALMVAYGIHITQQDQRLLGWLEEGARIGCTGRFRAASVYKNTKGSYQCGREVSDAIAAWVRQGYAFGPVPEEEVPATAKINSILTRPKPNGSVRVILNLSAPKGFSVNEGIDTDEFPAVMSSTEAWL
jgi:hypothetical protein